MFSFTVLIYTLQYFADIAAGSIITLDVSNPAPKVGEDVEFTCHVQSDVDRFGFLVRWLRQHEGVTKEIGVNNFLEREFRTNDRFRASMNRKNIRSGQVDATLHITGNFCSLFKYIFEDTASGLKGKTFSLVLAFVRNSFIGKVR